MKIPVLPFLYSITMMFGAALVLTMHPHGWGFIPISVAIPYFWYSSYREIWHNGQPLVLRRRK